MGHARIQPIDLAHDDLGSFRNFDACIRSEIEKRVEAAHAEGRWRSPEDMLWNPRDLDFMAYWAQKCINPITRPMKGSNLEAHFRPFLNTQFDLTPPGFSVTRAHRLSAVGDLMPTVHLEDSVDRLYRHIANLVFGADCAFANLECSVAAGTPMNLGDFAVGEAPVLNVTPDEYRALTRHQGRRFDVLQLANNHVLDGGEIGVARTLEALRRDKVDFVGVHETEADAGRPKTTRLGDITIGWIAHTYSVNLHPLPSRKPWLIDVTPFHVERSLDVSRISRQIEAARAAGSDLVLVCLHWGAEWEFFPLPAQLDWAHAFAEAGADAIIGTHPHVIQPVEVYRPAATPWKSVPILYSLGNLTATMGAAYTTLSLVANLTLATGSISGERRTVITALDLAPVAFMGEEEDGRRYAACVPLADLNAGEHDPETRDYVQCMAAYADIVLGEGWRAFA